MLRRPGPGSFYLASGDGPTSGLIDCAGKEKKKGPEKANLGILGNRNVLVY